MLTVKRIINGDRVITVHERVRLGDKMSRVYKEALKVVNGEDNELCFYNAIDLPRKPKPVGYTALTDMSVEEQKSTLANLHPFLHNVSDWTVVIGGRPIPEDVPRVVIVNPRMPSVEEKNSPVDEIYIPGNNFYCRFCGFTQREMTYVMPPQEIQLVRELINEDGDTFYLNQLRSGKHSVDEAIGVLHVDDAYEFFYPGDVVYVMNSEGKTIDTLR